MKQKKFRKYLPFYVMGLPGLIYLFINNYMPLPGLMIAFERYSYKKGLFMILPTSS